MEGSQGWDAAANDAYVTIVGPRTAHYSTDALLLSPPSKHHSVLEVACGPGHLSIQAARMGVHHVVATDWSPQMILHLQKSLLNETPLVQQSVKAFVEDGETLSSIPNSSMDKIYSMFGIFLFPRAELAIKAAFRVLKPKGQLIISLWLPLLDPAPSHPSVLKIIFDHMGVPDQLDKFKGQAEKFKALLLQNGFGKVEEVKVSHSFAFADKNELLKCYMGRNPGFDSLKLNASAEKLEECENSILKYVYNDRTGPCAIHADAIFLIASKQDDLNE